MRTWWKQFLPFLIGLSLLGNLYLVRVIHQRDDHLNRFTWGNAVDTVWHHVNMMSVNLMPGPDGRLYHRTLPDVEPARRSLELLRSLPHYNRRVDPDDMRTLEQFLRYADRSYALAVQEQGEAGKPSPESQERLAKVREGMEFILTHQDRTNQVKSSQNPWNHAEWRAVWRSTADGLKAMEFVPLPD